MGDAAYYILNAAASAPRQGTPYRVATLNGRKYWVVPFVSLVEGVLNGSKGPLYYPRDEIRRNPGAWNGTLLTNGHPSRPDGTALSGKWPETVDSHGLGWVYNDWADETRRGGEAWFDQEWTRNKAPRVAAKLERGELVELSTGLKTEDWPAPPGSRDSRGRGYLAVARNYGPDHLAVLDGVRGACSLDDGCGIGRGRLTANAAPSPGLCPVCGSTLNEAGNCPECGWEPGKQVSTWEKAGARTAAKNEEAGGLLTRMWEATINAVLGQPKSTVTGQYKEPGSGTGDGPIHQAAQAAFYHFTPSDEEKELGADAERQKAETGENPPNWAVQEKKWEKAKRIAGESGKGTDWAYVVGIYQRMGGTIKGKPARNHDHQDCHCGGTCGKCGVSSDGSHQGDDMKTRAENVAFLVANCDAWKGKTDVLNSKAGDKYVLDDQAVAAMAANAEAAATLNSIVKDVGVPDGTALNAMPAFIKDKMKAKDKEEPDGDEPDPKKTTNQDTQNQQAPVMDFSKLTQNDLDKLSQALFGKPLSVVREDVANSGQYKDREKEIVINKLVRHLPDDKKAERRKKLSALALNELYDRLADMPDDVRNGGSGDDHPIPVFGGRLVPPDVRNSEGADEVFDITTMNWNKPKAGSAA